MKRKSLKTNALLNAIRTVLATFLQLITYPYIFRILGVDSIGKVNFSASIISYFILIALLEFNGYASREGAKIRNNREEYTRFASQIFTMNLMSMLLSYALLAIIVFFSPPLHAYIVLLFVQSFQILGNSIAIEWHYIVHEDYFYITLRSIFIQIISVVMIFCFVRNSNDYVVYAGINTFSLSIGYIYNLTHALKDYRIRFTAHPDIKKHIKPIMIFFIIKASTTVYISADTTMLGLMCNDYYTGLYSLVNKVYTIVKSLVQSVFSVSIPRLTEEASKGDNEAYNRDVGNIFDTLLMFLLPVMAGLFLTAKDIVLLLGGKEYINAAWTLKILSVALLFAMFAGFIISTIFTPKNGEKYTMMVTLFTAIENIALNVLFIPRLQDKGAAITTCIAEGTCMLIMVLLGRKEFSFPIYKGRIRGYIMGVLGIICVCLVTEQVNFPVVISFVLKVSISALLYFVILLIFRNPIISDLITKVTGFTKNRKRR